MPRVTLFTTSTPTTLHTKSAIRRLSQLLNALRVPYEIVDLAEEPERRADMLVASGGDSTLPQLHVDGVLVGDAARVAELNDFGELMPALTGQRLPAGTARS
jgi:glutaredoxin-related protein